MLSYRRACMLELKEKYYTNLSNTINTFNDSNKLPLSNMKIREAILKVMRWYEEGSITDANNVTDDTFIHASIPQRENLDAIFTSKKIEKSDKLVDAVKSLTINDARYELNTATTSDAQGHLTSNIDTVTHTSNRILDLKLVSYRTIREVSVSPTPTNPSIVAIRLTPHMLLTPEMKEIFMYATSGNAWTNRTPRQMIRAGIYESIPISTPINSVVRKYSSPDSSYSSRTSITIETSDTTTSQTLWPQHEPKYWQYKAIRCPRSQIFRQIGLFHWWKFHQ